MSKTSIAWCDHSINPIRARDTRTEAVGHFCQKISAGCQHCYASRLQSRFQMPAFQEQIRLDTIELFLDTTKLDEVRRRKKPTRYFWADMTDLFGSWVNDAWLDACFATMALTPQHTHMVLTKRPQRMLKYLADTQTPFRVAQMIDVLQVRHEIETSVENIKSIDNYPGYYVSNTGMIYTSTGSAICCYCGAITGQYAMQKYCSQKCRQNAAYHRRKGHYDRFASTLKPVSFDVGEKGHCRVMLYRNGCGTRELVHRLVLSAFDRPPVGNEQGCHRDGNPRNNHIANLQWGTQGDNWKDRKRHGNHQSYHKLDMFKIEEIKKRSVIDHQSFEEIAKIFHVSSTQISNIVKGKQWSIDTPIEWPLKNCWLGTSVEHQDAADTRIPILLQVPAALRFLSVEPILAPVNLAPYLATGGVGWVIVGGESGSQARPCQLGWLETLVWQCRQAQVPCFVKQVGARAYDLHVLMNLGQQALTRCEGCPACRFHTADPKGADPLEWPATLRVQEFPAHHNER